MAANYQGMPTEELINEFISSELRVPIPLVKEICNRPDSVPYLARIIEGDIYWEIGGPGDAWSPIHALHLLGGIKTPDLIEGDTKMVLQKFLHTVEKNSGGMYKVYNRFTFDNLFRALLNENFEPEDALNFILCNCSLSAIIFEERIYNKYYLTISAEN